MMMNIWRYVYRIGAALMVGMLIIMGIQLIDGGGNIVLDARPQAETISSVRVIFMLLLFGLPAIGLVHADIQDSDW